MIKDLVEIIKSEVKKQNVIDSSRIGLPTCYNYLICEDTLYLTIFNPESNMQNDKGAFDSWALAIYRWIPEIKKIILIWGEPENNKNSNYQRFLYRIKKSTEIYKWLEVYEDCEHLLKSLSIEDQGLYVSTLPSQEASENSKDIEAIRELMFSKDFNVKLAEISGMDNANIYRQLPVGIYKEKKATANEIFPGRGATIDLWGLNESKKELHLFELKANNKPMGIYSQLFFYSMIQYDLMNGVFETDNPNNSNFRGYKYLTDFGYKNFNSIKAHFLVDELHPLIDSVMIDTINQSLKLAGKNITFDIIKYEFDGEELLELQLV